MDRKWICDALDEMRQAFGLRAFWGVIKTGNGWSSMNIF